MEEVRRSADGELCGYVNEYGGKWQALTVFGGVLADFDTYEPALNHVLSIGLSSLSERWWYREDPQAEWQVVCIQEASSEGVRLALGYYSIPGVPSVSVSRDQLRSSVEITLKQP